MSPKQFCVAALAATCLGPALAVPFANSSLDLTSLSFTLQDTDANDGIDASFTQQFMGRSVNICPGVTADGFCSVDSGGLPYQQTSEASQTIFAHAATAGVQGMASAGPAWLGNSLQGTGLTTTNGGANATSYFDLQFLGPGRFTAAVDYTINAGLGGESSWREVLAWAGIVIGPRHATYFQTEQLLVAPGSGTESRSGRLSISFDVLDGQGYQAWLHTHTHTAAAAIAAPVPEPATWALMLAGLVGVTQVARRRSR